MLADFLTTSPRGAERFRPEALLFLCVAALVGAVAHLLAVRLLAPSFPVGYAASAGLALLVGTACAAHATGAVAARAAALPGMLTLAALGGYGWVVAHLWDTSPDADAYHISGILGLASGWVPSQGPFGGDMRVDHWPHGHWALETAAYALWGDVEAGKVVCLLYVLAAGGVMAAAVCVLRGRPTRLDLGLIALTVANPVVFSQLLTHYLDGVVYLLCLMLLFGLYLADTVHRRAGCWIVAATVILLINTKTAGLYYGGMLVFGYMLAHLARWRDLTHTPHGLRARAAVPALAAAAALLAIVVGTRPYVVNWVEHRAVVYPDLSRIMRGQRPANLAKAAPPTQLLYLIFGKTGGGQGEAVILKVPGTVSPSEWR